MEKEMVINLDRAEITKKIQTFLDNVILQEMASNKVKIENSVKRLFKVEMFDNASDLESQLEWTLSSAVQRGFEKALRETGFEETVTKMVGDMLQDEKLIAEFAKKKIEQSLGIK